MGKRKRIFRLKVFTHNFNPASNSGPNKFSRQLIRNLIEKENYQISIQDDADIEFCLIQQQFHKKKPMVLRLDGIYFNSDQDYEKQNSPIRFAYENADSVVFQSKFNKLLTEHWFGIHPNSHVIHNAYFGEKVKDNIFQKTFPDKEIWSCASSWRPHKRLLENIKYYLTKGPDKSIFVVAGDVTNDSITENERYQISQLRVPESKAVMFYGNLSYDVLRQLYDASTTFVHLAYLDHCPNVVVDSQAHGCHVVCSSTGGTKEIVNNGTIIQEGEWDFSPIKLYDPPKMEFNNTAVIKKEFKNDLGKSCLEKYKKVFEETKRGKK